MTLAGASRRWWRRHLWPPREISDRLWRHALNAHPLFADWPEADRTRLRRIATYFLDQKQFSGTHGLVVTDAMAVTVAAQACVPLLHMEAGSHPEAALRWYDDSVGIVLYPAEALAHRQEQDAAGVVHAYDIALAGEAMLHGPVMLSWAHVCDSGDNRASSVVIHEFAHQIDMRSGHADGVPPLPAGFLGSATPQAAREAWRAAWAPAYRDFRRSVVRAERFGEPEPWPDAYGASAPAEFFAVLCEAYFVDRPRFEMEFPSLLRALDAFFLRRPIAATPGRA